MSYRAPQPARNDGLPIPLILILAIAHLVLTACSSNPRLPQPPLDPHKAGQLAISLHDADGDGAIAHEELERCPGLQAAIATVDRDGDQRLTAAEITERLQAQRATGLSQTTINCMVFYRGRPLADASIRFVPEEFLGDGIKTAIGTTNEHGTAVMGIPDAENPGIHCGFYRVEISRQDTNGDEMIPAQYNVSSELGQEIAPRVPREGVVHIRLK